MFEHLQELVSEKDNISMIRNAIQFQEENDYMFVEAITSCNGLHITVPEHGHIYICKQVRYVNNNILFGDDIRLQLYDSNLRIELYKFVDNNIITNERFSISYNQTEESLFQLSLLHKDLPTLEDLKLAKQVFEMYFY